MNLDQIYIVSEIISALAVVISLIYLGVQVKHSRIQSKNQAFDLIATQRGQFTNLLAIDKDLSRIVARGLAGKSKLHPNEYYRFTSYLYNLSINLELAHKKWLKKDLDKESWRAWDEASQWWFVCPGVQTWWKNNPVGGFTADYKNYVNACIAKLNMQEIPNLERVLEFLEMAGEQP